MHDSLPVKVVEVSLGRSGLFALVGILPDGRVMLHGEPVALSIEQAADELAAFCFWRRTPAQLANDIRAHLARELPQTDRGPARSYHGLLASFRALFQARAERTRAQSPSS